MYPNHLPTVANLEELGFERISAKYNEHVLQKNICGIDVFIYLWEETQIWDGSDCLHIRGLMEMPCEPLHVYQSKGVGLGGYIGTHGVLTIEELETEIEKWFSDTKKSREENLRKSYIELREAYREYGKIKDLKWSI